MNVAIVTVIATNHGLMTRVAAAARATAAAVAVAALGGTDIEDDVEAGDAAGITGEATDSINYMTVIM
jgi:hypothetical protein